jgi:hypothetical protein
MIEVTVLIAEAVVTFTGVFLAFSLDRYIDREKEQKARKELLRNIMEELERIKDELLGEAKLLYTDIYDSAVTSGKLDLLNTEQLTKLTNVYRKIKEQEHEATRIRDRHEAETQDTLELGKLRHNNALRRTELIKTIGKVLAEYWLNVN